jgi:hypothetical protein
LTVPPLRVIHLVSIAITGGTGAYRTAHGELETSGPNEAGDEPLTLRLILGDH